MGTTLSFLSHNSDNADSPLLPLWRGTPSDVKTELSKLPKPEVQRYQEIVRQIENLHEGVEYKAGYQDDDVDIQCAECQLPWPCATYKLIHPPQNDNEEAPF